VQAFAQHGFDGGFPARIDAQLLEKARQAAEGMALEPVP
jgi:hypothetical protein